MKVKLEHNCRRAPFETGLNNIGCMDKILSNPATPDQAGLITVDDLVNQWQGTVRKALGSNLDGAILEGNRAVVFRLRSVTFFGKKNNMSSVDTFEIGRTRMKI